MLEGPATRTGVAVDYYASEEALLRALAAWGHTAIVAAIPERSVAETP